MRKLLWSPQALRDLEGIRDYIALDSARYAALVIERIVNGVERLSTFPESGRMVPERNDPGLGGHPKPAINGHLKTGH